MEREEKRERSEVLGANVGFVLERRVKDGKSWGKASGRTSLSARTCPIDRI
jgi:hypothetical protein